MTDQKRNEFTVVKRLMVMLVLIELIFTIFVSMTGNNILSIGCTPQSTNPTCACTPQSTNPTCAISNNEQNINGTANSLFNSFDCVTNNQNNTGCAIRTSYTFSSNSQGTGCLFIGCPIQNFYYGTVAVGVGILNAIIGFVTMFAYALALIGEMFILIFLPVTIIPAIFQQANLGNFGQLFKYLYGGVGIVIIVYVGYIILNRVRGN